MLTPKLSFINKKELLTRSPKGEVILIQLNQNAKCLIIPLSSRGVRLYIQIDSDEQKTKKIIKLKTNYPWY